MPHSTSIAPSGLVLDTNVLSLLAAASKLTLLQEVANAPLYITPRIAEELHIGIHKGVSTLNNVLNLIYTGEIQVLQLTSTEQVMRSTLPNKLAQGEAEAIAICRQRNMIFITRDHKAANYCEREGISCIRFKNLLIQFQVVGLLTQQEVNAILI